MSWISSYFRFPLIWKIAIGFVLGAIVGLLVGPSIAVIRPLGTLFLRLLQMLVVPLIFFTLVVGAASVSPSRLGRVGGKVIVYYLVTSAVAITLGVLIALAVQPGAGLLMPAEAPEARTPPALSQVLLEIVPTNPFQALSRGDVLAVIFFALIVGLSISAMEHAGDRRVKEQAGLLFRLSQGATEVMFRIVRGVLEYAPFGVFALIAVTLGTVGVRALVPLGKLTGVVYGGVALQIVFYVVLLKLFRQGIRRFFSAAQDPMLTAFVTRSSSGTLPVTMRAAERLGISESIYGFSLPLGATVNMDGTALYIGASVIFVANVAGVSLTPAQLVGVIVTGTLASIGTAGVPGAGLIMLSLAITQAGLPMGPVALVAGIDAILDMVRTMCNVTGDLVGTQLVAATEPGLEAEEAQATSVAR
ncbi:dicarboxylate/amino acid:cation symporter [Limnochorda pilosa]|uniref:Amino acid transporter n=1 Tax=Limnochorda pilosa TaxID=1555112 RepID=A0A0K2SKZ4_LIMPI|nr:dicarboxylate/amino acid:cation symporter [Limnochorda pilosa]BAS27770.1 amino acid transporter [Limnochorda pilosa]